MNLPVYSLENKKIIYFFLAIMLIGGIYSFFKLPKKEDSPFVIKQAVLVTQYPGATPQEVEKLITEPIEREIQSMSDVFQIKSESYFGMSKISIELQPTLAPDYMPVKWDELRRKVANIQPRLPSGASAINVSDDFGDVFGIYYALTADEGFTYDDMRDWAQKIKTELTPIQGVQKVYLFAEQTQVVNVRISVPSPCRMFFRSSLNLISACRRSRLSCSRLWPRIICRSSGTNCVVRWLTYSLAFRVAPLPSM